MFGAEKGVKPGEFKTHTGIWGWHQSRLLMTSEVCAGKQWQGSMAEFVVQSAWWPGQGLFCCC